MVWAMGNDKKKEWLFSIKSLETKNKPAHNGTEIRDCASGARVERHFINIMELVPLVNSYNSNKEKHIAPL